MTLFLNYYYKKIHRRNFQSRIKRFCLLQQVKVGEKRASDQLFFVFFFPEINTLNNRARRNNSRHQKPASEKKKFNKLMRLENTTRLCAARVGTR